MKKKWIQVKNHPGIRKIIMINEQTGQEVDFDGKKYKVWKSIKGERTTKCFETLREADHWKNTFNGASCQRTISPPELQIGPPLQQQVYLPMIQQQPNGLRFQEAFERYKEAVFPDLEDSTIDYKLQKERYFVPFFKYNINEVTPEMLDHYIKHLKAEAIATSNKRYTFDKELSQIRAFFNWYRENYDYRFSSPLLKRHFALGKIKEKKERNVKMSGDEVMTFFNSLRTHCPPVFYDLAIVQFFIAGRISEAAGLIKDCINIEERILTVKNVLVWERKTKQVKYLKPFPKNTEIRYCSIEDFIYECLTRRLASSPANCKYVFEIDGRPLTYREIQYQYDKALEKCGLSEKYSGTHIMRHASASITRKITHSLDHAQAMTGIKDAKVLERYTGSPSDKQVEAVKMLSEFMREKLSESGCVHPDAP